jgi:diguanylate cyclase (GGDEF)-like protein/PAS domain S-box-containing protein
MPPEYILPVLYDLTLTIGGETQVKPLLTRFLRRLLYHTSFPAGIVFLNPAPAANNIVEAIVGTVVGDYELVGQEGKSMKLPAALLENSTLRQENDAGLLNQLGSGRYHAFLRLPIPDDGIILLLAPVLPESELPLLNMFQPVLARLANAFRLCRESEARTKELLDNNRNISAQLQLMASVYDSLHSGVMITSASGEIIAVNPSFTRITGYPSEEVLGRNPRLFSSGRQNQQFYQSMWLSITEQGYWQGEIWNRKKNGEIFPEWLTITRVHNGTAEGYHYVGIFSDITEQKEAQQKIEFMAHHDLLTNLPNRLLLQDRFEHAAAYARRNGSQVALLFLDLDNFKNINDIFGHAMGDQLLINVTDRLHSYLRESDVLARLGGDEFVIVLANVTDTSSVALAAEKLVRALRAPFEIENHIFHIGGSIGVSLYPTDAEDFDSLLKHADMAMYRAKFDGRDTFHFFTQDMNQLAHARLDMERRLRTVMEAKEFVLHYQPQVTLPGRSIIGVEALLRWPSNTGPIPPAQFIPVAEECGLIVPLGEWVVREACHCAQKWRERGFGEKVMAVNLSAVQFKRGNIVEVVRNALADSGLPPHCLELELTESMLIQDTSTTLEIVCQLKELGVKLSLDDFGTGYSNMSYLKRLRVDKLKIDQSFVRDMVNSAEALAIVRAMIEVGHSLNLIVTAEGVETESQATLLHQLGCQLEQGYLFYHPMTEHELEEVFHPADITQKR